MDVSGKVKVIFDKQTFDSGFEKREFVITTQEQYPQDIKFELYKDKCSIIDNFKQNDDVTVHFNIRGNEYNGRYYVNLNAWKIDTENIQEQGMGNNSVDSVSSSEEDSPFDTVDDTDDLPF